jgi:2-dehydropantoate 2-reductase
MTTIALIGPGAIGGTIAAWLGERSGNDVTVCVRTPFDKLIVEVPGGRTLEATPKVLRNPDEAKPVDWVLAVTKTYDTEGAARWLRRLVGESTRVAVIQNGVEHMNRFVDLVPRARVLPVIVDIPADRSGPGRIRQRRHGDITVPRSEIGRAFALLFEGLPLAPAMVDDFLSASWRKLALNSSAIVNALALKPAGIVHQEKIATLMRAIAAEAVAVARAVGARLDDGLPDEVIARSLSAPPDLTNSLLADRLGGRPLEVDARNGIIVRQGALHGIATPLNAMAVAILEASVS